MAISLRELQLLSPHRVAQAPPIYISPLQCMHISYIFLTHTFLTHIFLSHHRTSCLDLFLFTLPRYYIFIYLLPLFLFTRYQYLKWIFGYKISSSPRQVTTLHICSFTVCTAAISLPPRTHETSFYTTLAITFLALQQVLYFIPAIHNDSLTSGSSYHIILVLLDSQQEVTHVTIGHPVFLPHPISREIGGVRCKTD